MEEILLKGRKEKPNFSAQLSGDVPDVSQTYTENCLRFLIRSTNTNAVRCGLAHAPRTQAIQSMVKDTFCLQPPVVVKLGARWNHVFAQYTRLCK